MPRVMQPFGLNKNPRCIYSRATARENNRVDSVDVGRAIGAGFY